MTLLYLSCFNTYVSNAPANIEALNIDGDLFEMSQAWRVAIRREYRTNRRKGYGPMGARALTESFIHSL